MFHTILDKKDEFFKNPDFSVAAIENYLDMNIYNTMYNELQNIPIESYDRYENPFEKKYTLRKSEFPQSVKNFLESFESTDFLTILSEYYPAKKIVFDTPHHYWGVHKFGKGDSLSIHADAGIHPFLNKPKFFTIGLYLNGGWEESMQGSLELWDGESLENDLPEISRCFRKIQTKPNTFVMFENSKKAWHGAPEAYQGDLKLNPRYFVTLSLLLDEDPEFHYNKRKRAYFAKNKHVDDTKEISEFRKLRADDTKAGDLYRFSTNKS
jgi:Rps23 Pro-64 3,4-dihydroxylase Tpa1-like proline 4-hydroxylase